MTENLTVLAPVTGTAVAMSNVDDPVFSAGIVGPGIAVEPDPESGRDVAAPITGTIVKLHPHAFVIASPGGRGVLVHLGIDTVQLAGEGFTLHAAEGDEVAAGQRLISWDPAAVVAGGRAAVCPVVCLDATPESVTTLVTASDEVARGTELLVWA